ncbi:hypothetical protein [Deinococcus roseus]|uniref:DUF2207 domain-containing protein n=1 Tax=Deinococcus roseus TaxID=392414 RepID=A0ABQ2DJH8_9DEIO|nr:hypothetical protein [Deinococcus roseus]GGJ59699.1 hypothetical protein GCM10008938_52280 [Deinococcus roseus]
MTRTTQVHRLLSDPDRQEVLTVTVQGHPGRQVMLLELLTRYQHQTGPGMLNGATLVFPAPDGTPVAVVRPADNAAFLEAYFKQHLQAARVHLKRQQALTANLVLSVLAVLLLVASVVYQSVSPSPWLLGLAAIFLVVFVALQVLEVRRRKIPAFRRRFLFEAAEDLVWLSQQPELPLADLIRLYLAHKHITVERWNSGQMPYPEEE